MPLHFSPPVPDEIEKGTPVDWANETHDHIFLFEYEGHKRVIVSQATDGSPQSTADLKTYLDEYRLAIASTETFLELAKDAKWTPPPAD